MQRTCASRPILAHPVLVHWERQCLRGYGCILLIERLLQVYNQAAPVVKDVTDTAAPYVKKGLETAGEVAGPVVKAAEPVVKVLLSHQASPCVLTWWASLSCVLLINSTRHGSPGATYLAGEA